MGKAQQRKKLDPSLGKNSQIIAYKKDLNLTNPEMRTLSKASLFLENSLKQKEFEDRNRLTLLTNEDKGYTDREIALFQEIFPTIYKQKNFSLFVLPKRYANLPMNQALDYCILICGD